MWFNYALQAEKVHAGLYKRAKDNAEKGKDLGFFPIHVCGQLRLHRRGRSPGQVPRLRRPQGKIRPLL